jgi:hypothetical protein
LKIESAKLFRRGWSLLTEVPGWPNAPIAVRWRRALPIALPAVGMLVLTGWKFAISNPGVERELASRQPLIGLEAKVAGLRISCTTRAATDLRDRASGAAGALMDGAQDLDGRLAELGRNASAQGWEATFQGVGNRGNQAPAATYVGCVPEKANFRPAAGNPHAWDTLLLILDRLSVPEQPIDLTSLTIRADEEGHISVDAGLRVLYLIADEKITK